MSRVGNSLIVIPEKVSVKKTEQISIEGPLGSLSIPLFSNLKIEITDKHVLFTRDNDDLRTKALHGLNRTLCYNAVVGVSTGWFKILEINGIGYKVQKKANSLVLNLGYSHDVVYDIPKGIDIEIIEQLKVKVKGFDKSLVGQVAADIRKKRPPEPYKGKGIKYQDEVIIRKVGKTGKK